METGIVKGPSLGIEGGSEEEAIQKDLWEV